MMLSRAPPTLSVGIQVLYHWPGGCQESSEPTVSDSIQFNFAVAALHLRWSLLCQVNREKASPYIALCDDLKDAEKR